MPIPSTPPPPIGPPISQLRSSKTAHDAAEAEQTPQQTEDARASRGKPDVIEHLPPSAVAASASTAAAEPKHLAKPQQASQGVGAQPLHRVPKAPDDLPKQNAIMRLFRRITSGGKHALTPEQKADAVTQWLLQNDFITRVSPETPFQSTAKFFDYDTNINNIFKSRKTPRKCRIPWLKEKQAAALSTLLFDHMHASQTDPSAVTASARECLVRYFKASQNDETGKAITQSQLIKTDPPLMRLSAYHMDDIFFNPSNPLRRNSFGSSLITPLS